MSEWIKAFAEVAIIGGDKIPSGFKTLKQIAIEINKKERCAWDVLSKLRENGLVETKTFKIPVNGTLRSTKHYKLKK